MTPKLSALAVAIAALALPPAADAFGFNSIVAIVLNDTVTPFPGGSVSIVEVRCLSRAQGCGPRPTAHGRRRRRDRVASSPRRRAPRSPSPPRACSSGLQIDYSSGNWWSGMLCE